MKGYVKFQAGCIEQIVDADGAATLNKLILYVYSNKDTCFYFVCEYLKIML